MKKENIKQYFIGLKNLLWSFKWYVLSNLLFVFLLLWDCFFPPEADDPIWRAEAVHGLWNYANREVYIESAKIGVIISVLVFLLATSNMRNHPKIAKLVFLSPWLFALWHLSLLLLGMEDY